MEIDRVITLRSALKAGKNIPLTVYIDNAFKFIDESMIGHFVFWDDANGYLYDISYPDMMADHNPGNVEAISAFCVGYASIQSMYASMVPLTDIDNLFDSMATAGKVVDADRRAMIKNFFKKTLGKDVFNISREELNKLLGADLNTDDDYYNGRMTENFKETIRYKDRNDAIDKAKEEAESKE